VFGQTDNSYLESLVEKANPEAGYGDGVYDVLSDIVYDSFYDYQEDNFAEYEDVDDWSENSPVATEIFSKIVEIEGEKAALHHLEMGEELGGIYQLYANLDNMYVVDGKGVAWNELRPEGLPKIERHGVKDVPYRTRDVAEWARENGFDGVIFKNIRDNGAYGRTPAGDVYAFFRPESQVKSADPVTYDDNGNVIPLSERFNSENDDIRFSSRNELSHSEYNRLTTKKPIRVSKQELAMIRAQRKTKYSGMEEYDIPILDFFKIGDYRIPNNGFTYYIRNSGPDNFSVVMKKRIVPNIKKVTMEVIEDENRRGNAETDSRVGQKRGERGTDRGSGERIGNGRELYENDRGAVKTGKSERDLHTRQSNSDSGTVIKWSDRSHAPTFYSQMGKVVEGVKLQKLDAKSVVSMLRGKGVKAEEIRWSGIVQFLDGKKSATKQELLDFINGSMLQIGEQVSGYNQEAYAELDALWLQHAGVSLSETFSDDFDLPLTEDNMADVFDDMEREGYDVPTIESQRRMLELARKAGNEGRWSKYKLGGGTNYRELVFTMPDSSYSNDAMRVHWGQGAQGVLAHARIQDFDVNGKKMLFVEEIQSDWHNEGAKSGYQDDAKFQELQELEAKANEAFFALEDYSTEVTGNAGEYEAVAKTQKGRELLRAKIRTEKALKEAEAKFDTQVPDAPFRKTYHEYVLKRLLRMAAENGYDSIGWTPSEIQSKRWSEEFAEGYRIEYDQDIPKFLRKYGGQWGAAVGKTKLSNGTEVWMMPVTPLMKASVLNEGQVLYSDRALDAASDRDLSGLTEYELWYDAGNASLEVEKWEREIRFSTKTADVDYRKTLEKKLLDAKEKYVEYGEFLIDNCNKYPLKRLYSFAFVMHIADSFSMPENYSKEQFKKDLKARVDEYNKSLDDAFEGNLSPEDKKLHMFLKLMAARNGETISEDEQESTVSSDHDWLLDEAEMPFSDRDPDAVSTRNLLANSLESAAQNDIERNKLKEYKSKIDLIEAEEAKLTELRAEIKELSFAKGPRDTAKIRKLQDSATIAANRINTYDRQLLTLEASKPLQNVLQREKEMARKRQQQKDAENLRAYKEKAAATQRELMTRYQESRKSAVEGRHKTEMRHKIKSVVSELNNLLLHGSKERNVKLGLQPAVASALEAVNMDTVAAEERIAKLEAELMKAKTPEKMQEISRKIDNIRNQGDVMASRLEALRRAYADIKASSDNIPEHYRSEASLIADKVDSVMQKVGNTPLRNMNLSQLESVYELYRMVLTTVRNTNTLFRQGKLEDLQQNVSDIMTEVAALPKLKEERLKIGGVVNSFSWNEMIPVYAFERIGSKTLSKFFWETIKGQNTYATDINEANEFAKAAREKFGYDKWDTAKIHEFKLSDGRTFRLTLKHMMSIYAYSKRNQALEHMRKGGFFFNDKETFSKKGGVLSFVKTNEEGYYVDETVLSSIVGAMTQEQIHYVDAMQSYLTSMGEKGNEVSRVLWGIDIFKEKVYFPLKSSKDFIFQANQTAQEASLKNDGMTKEVKPGASNPIILEAFDDVWASHVNRMSQYHAFVLPIENLNKIHNYGSWAGTASVSVSTMLAARHGAAVNEYLTDFIKDLNGASSSQGASNPFFSLLSKFKKTAVAASASVVVQQPTAILRAMAVMDSKYFVGKPSMNWNELKKYAPIAIIKEIGGFDAGAGRQAAQWLNDDTLRGTEKVMNTIDEASMKGAAFGDRIGWSAIWDAVKREIKATTNLQVGSEEFLQKAGERFTEVIVLTQVYDSTLSRSGYMRSKHDSVKMLTAFMGEPTVSFNMMYNAAVQAKRGNITKRKATRMLSAVYASVIAASAAASLVYALRDDDEDESYLEKFAEALGGKLLSDINPLNMLPAVRDIFSILDGWEVERTDVAIFQDIKNAFDALSSENKSAWRKIEDFSGAIASLFGLPLKNVLRTGREIYNGINDIFDGIGPSNVGGAFVRGITGEKKNKSEALYNAIVNGDATRIGLYRKDYKDEKSYELAVRTALRENDSRIKEAAQARKDGDSAKYASIVREIISEGHFSQDIVVGAVNNELTSLNKGGSTSSSSDAEEKDASSIYSSYDINQALEDGDTRQALTIIEDIVKVKTENYINDGEKAKDAETKAKSSVRSSLTSYWKPLYLAAYERRDNAEMARIRNLLYATKIYGNASELVKTAQNWVKDSK
jgi:hypothetical protein